MEKFPKKKKEDEIESTQKELEKLYEVSISPGSSGGDIEKCFRGGEYIAFVVSKDFKIYLSASGHASIFHATDLWEYKFRGFVGKDDIEFYDKSLIGSGDRNAVVAKIKKFLNDRGLKNSWAD